MSVYLSDSAVVTAKVALAKIAIKTLLEARKLIR